MERGIYTKDYKVLLALLRETRRAAAMTQVALAACLGQRRPFVSRVELGDWRLDVIQLRMIYRMLETTLATFVTMLKERLANQ